MVWIQNVVHELLQVIRIIPYSAVQLFSYEVYKVKISPFSLASLHSEAYLVNNQVLSFHLKMLSPVLETF